MAPVVFELDRLDVTRLAQIPRGWPADNVANTLELKAEGHSVEGGTIQIAGQLIGDGDVAQETHQVMRNMEAVLAAAGLDVDLGLSYNVFETRADGQYLRELKLALIRPATFEPELDL